MDITNTNEDEDMDLDLDDDNNEECMELDHIFSTTMIFHDKEKRFGKQGRKLHDVLMNIPLFSESNNVRQVISM